MFFDKTTATATTARELHATAKAKEFDFPGPSRVGRPGEEQGVLTVRAGGDVAPFDNGQSVIAG